VLHAARELGFEDVEKTEHEEGDGERERASGPPTHAIVIK